MDCDNCNKEIIKSDFYVLTTSQVMISQDYWKNYLTLGESYRPGFFKNNPMKFMESVKQLSEFKSNWAFCSNCISLIYDPFQVEEKRKAKEWAKRHANGEKINVPGSGPANPAIFLPFVSMAWKNVYGSNLQDLLKSAISGNGAIISHEIGTKKSIFKRLFGK